MIRAVSFCTSSEWVCSGRDHVFVVLLFESVVIFAIGLWGLAVLVGWLLVCLLSNALENGRSFMINIITEGGWVWVCVCGCSSPRRLARVLLYEYVGIPKSG